ncbi:MAG: F0F1 ATP synthase subunit epsilon [Caldilineaceae bacterium]
MRLKVLLPQEVLLEQPVCKVVAEAENGAFCLLPRHIDFVAALVPGLLAYTTPAGQERFLAIDQGILVKKGSDVLLSTTDAVVGPDLGVLQQTVTELFQNLDERERHARSALASLEAEFIRRFIELKEE